MFQFKEYWCIICCAMRLQLIVLFGFSHVNAFEIPAVLQAELSISSEITGKGTACWHLHGSCLPLLYFLRKLSYALQRDTALEAPVMHPYNNMGLAIAIAGLFMLAATEIFQQDSIQVEHELTVLSHGNSRKFGCHDGPP
ncbi:MAG: hypothetical protein IPL65_09620 [Lewinellaceae bacterium]|nr:hypothetical protein [Lewinellaceae bacterium]